MARLTHNIFPIFGEQQGVNIRDNAWRSNKIVVRNSFLLKPATGPGFGWPPFVSGHPSVMLVLNNNDEVRNLDLVLDKISTGSVEALSSLVEISLVLSPELWNRWVNNGQQGTGIQVVGQREVRITNMETARLFNIPFDPREFLPFSIKTTILTGSGKNAPTVSPQLPNNYAFRITHQSSDGSPING